MRKNIPIILGLIGLSLIFQSRVLAVPPPARQEMSGQEQSRESISKEEKLKKNIQTKSEIPEVENKIPEEAFQSAPTPKIKVANIVVTGATILSEAEIQKIITPFKGQELDLSGMQQVAERITEAYRKKGFITSRAYLPPQKIENGVLELRILEASMGEVTVKGNRFFKPRLYSNMIDLKKGQPFDYNKLKRGLVDINEHPDRFVRAVLVPGKEAGTTDVVLEAKDNLPIHLGLGYDDFASRYVNRNRYTTTIIDNNLTGFGDVFTAQYQLSDAEDYILNSMRYLFPVTRSFDAGFYWSRSKLSLGREYQDAMARGKSKIFSLYATQTLIKQDNVVLKLNGGFDYKDIFNFQLGVESSRDIMRVAKIGLDLDVTDKFGRTLITEEFDSGIPDIMGGLKAKDPRSSRQGAGGKFIKNNVNILRLQKMPFNSNILWKNQMQFSPYILTATEQFQLGGISNLRGYPPAEYVGDQGYAMSWDWSFPPYFMPKKVKIPYLKDSVYDALRFVAFYDWARLWLWCPFKFDQ
ncbi:MAG: hypothetical protein NTY47_02840 [Candidatus Omnitrophica bacterium]|nr:hypothetical protein [Candidatus Omnitrophota bacterium]